MIYIYYIMMKRARKRGLSDRTVGGDHAIADAHVHTLLRSTSFTSYIAFIYVYMQYK